MSRERAEPPAGPQKGGRFQTGVRGLIVAVACFAMISWAGRRFWEFRHPAAAAARGLSTGNPSDRARATRELMVEGVREPGLATSPLIDALGDPSAEVRAGAAEALGVIAYEAIQNGTAGDLPRAATAALVRSLKDRDPVVRTAAAFALERIATTPGAPGRVDVPSVSNVLAGMLDDRDDEVRLLAFSTLQRCGALRTARPPAAIGAALEDSSARIRVASVGLLPRYPGSLDPWLASLLRIAEADELSVRIVCRMAFSRDPPAFSPAAIPALIAALGSRPSDVRFCAAQALEPYAQDPRVAAVLIPALLVLLREPAKPERYDNYHTLTLVCRMLGRIAPGTASAGESVAALAESVRSGDTQRRQRAYESLAEFGSAAEPAIPALIEALRQTLTERGRLFPYEAEMTSRALAKIAPGTGSACEVIATLAEVVRSEGAPERARVADALGAFGRAAEPAIPALIEALRQSVVGKEARPPYGGAVAQAVGRIAPGTSSADAAIAALIESLDPRPEWRGWTRIEAVNALAEFGAGAARALPRLRGLQEHSDFALRQAAGRAVRAIEGAGPGDG